jgi:hypothetical protein
MTLPPDGGQQGKSGKSPENPEKQAVEDPFGSPDFLAWESAFC